jgi:hypothetical protein
MVPADADHENAVAVGIGGSGAGRDVAASVKNGTILSVIAPEKQRHALRDFTELHHVT